ncbi:hypothetical protein [Nostoc sp.]|uniref:hypothetical protein n=1 Tax=Nostoc sp. TaxID=1180 RepID=UPI002FFB4A03
MSDVYNGLFGVALQKTLKIMRSPVVEEYTIALFRHSIINFVKLPILLLTPITTPTNTAKIALKVQHQHQLTCQSL